MTPDIDTSELMPRSADEYRSVLRVALDEHGRLDLDRISAWSASRRVVLKAALKRAGLDELSLEVPAAPRKPRNDLRVPSEDEIRRLRDEGWGSLEYGMRAVVFLLLQMGLRSAEALGLKRSEVERAVETGVIGITRKGGYEAQLPARHAQPLLEELLAAQAVCGGKWKRAGEVLHCGGEGSQYVALYRRVRSLGRLIGFPKLRPHLLRHAFASSMMRRGAPLAVVQRALGHAQQSTTLRYVHADSGDVEKYIETWDPEG